jgi:invasion protein IalB
MTASSGPAATAALPLILAIAAALAFSQPAVAQTAPAAQSPATASPAPGQPYIAAEHRDWQVICSRIEGEEDEACEIYQLLREPSGQPIAEISIAALAESGDIVAGATITTPLETFLPAGLGFRIGAQAEEMRIEVFRVCTVVGCIVRMGLSAAEIRAMEQGSDAFITIAPFVAVDRPVDIAVSLRGLTAAMRDLRARTPNPPEAMMNPFDTDQPPAAGGVDPSAVPPTPPAARP